ncbi:MAG: GspE/PulE family protein [Bacilli bacterium]|nr:GspE/PulE family protein [Bacilli bacterium]
MIDNQETSLTNNEVTEEVVQYVDQDGNPIDPSLIDENGNYIGQEVQYVDENGNPIDPSLIDENGNYIGNQPAPELSQEDIQNLSTSARAMDNKELLTSMVTFDYNSVPITDIVNSIILDAINKGASDIHFDPFPEGIKIRIRIDGVLHDYSIVPLYVKNNMITRIKIISSMNITESRLPQDGAIRTELANKTIDLRVACLPTSMGEKIAIRIMDYSMSSAGVEGLDFSPKNLNKVNKMLSLPNGIILVTGATGTGKSTTVYSMLQVLNSETRNIITVEDPIEMNIGGINQVQAQEEIGLTFANVLRSILREDPDVIMIGEIRDDETARIAIRASITGHLVLSTIHTNNSLNTIERLTDMSVERYLLGSSLEGVISQKLARRLCSKCKQIRPTTEYEKETFRKALNKEVNEIYVPVGCPECDNGYRGRIAIHEVCLINQKIRDAITKGADKVTLRNLVYNIGDTDTMLQDGLQKVLNGETSFDEILKLIDLDDDLGSGTQLGLEEQLEDSQMGVVPTNVSTTPQYMPYPVPMQFDPNMMKELIKALKSNKDEDKKDVKEEIKEEPIKEIDDEPIEELKEQTNDIKPIELVEEEIQEESLSSIEENDINKEEKIEETTEEPIEEIKDLHIKVDDDYKFEADTTPVVTLKLDSTNTVKPIPVFDDYEIVPEGKKKKKKNKKKKEYEDGYEVVSIKSDIKDNKDDLNDLNITNKVDKKSDKKEIKDDFEIPDEELRKILDSMIE